MRILVIAGGASGESLEPKSGGSPVSDPCPPVVCNEFQLLRRSPFG
jgi:hypothetical protein